MALCSFFLVNWKLENEDSTFFKTRGSTCLTKQHHILEDRGLHYCLLRQF